MAADHDLLFGLLALQNGLIDQGAFFAAFATWSRDKTRSMAEILVAEGAIDPSQRALMESLAGICLRRHDGDATKSLAALYAGCPSLERLALLGDSQGQDSLTELSTASTRDDSQQSANGTINHTASTGPRFRILRLHARGGLGAVFVALDTELNREVALKQILDTNVGDPTSRQRFLIEAQITGGLEHPGIVPVYSQGTSDDGRPYYAMRLIKGDSLKDAIAEFHGSEKFSRDPGQRSLGLRKLLRCFTDVCNAIDYAHSRGVLHRDIKPSNVIVGRHGETVVVDWGLAKATGRAEMGSGSDSGEQILTPSSASGSADTLPGSALGTPAYMSPEQADGNLDQVGPWSDIYSLGATLYTVLTGKRPFEDDDLGAVLRAVKAGAFSPILKTNPAVDGALAAICKKAMALRPEDRYMSARALAEDLERWMADEPVTAWREPLSRRARGWVKRHRTLVTGAAAAFVMALVGLGAVATVQASANSALAAANTQLVEANRRVTKTNADLTLEQEKVQARFALAMDAIRTFHTGVSEELLLKETPFDALRVRLLHAASDFYRRLQGMLQGRSDVRSRKVLGAAYFELGGLTARLLGAEQGLTLYRQALAIRSDLLQDSENISDARVDLAESLLEVGSMHEATGRQSEALKNYNEAETLLKPAATANPPGERAREDLGLCALRSGNVHNDMGHPAEALTAFQRARAIFQAVEQATPLERNVKRNLAASDYNIGQVFFDTGRPGEALAAHERARELRERLVNADPADTRTRNDLGRTYKAIAEAQRHVGRPDDARQSFARARAILEELVRKNPGVTAFRRELAGALSGGAELLSSTGHTSDALAALRESLAIREKLVQNDPAATGLKRDLAGSHYAIGNLLATIDSNPQAMESYQRSLAIYQSLADANPGVPAYRGDLARTHHNIGWLHSLTGKPSEALASYERAVAIKQAIVDANPADTQARSDLAWHHNNIAVVLLDIGKSRESLVSCEKARSIWQALADANPNVPIFARGVGRSLNNIGNALNKLGDATEAITIYERSKSIHERLVGSDPTARDYLLGLASCLDGQGRAFRSARRAADAAATFRRAALLWESLPAPNASNFANAAFNHAHYASLAAVPDSEVSPAAAEEQADRAIDSLRRAIAFGYTDLDHLRHNADLDPLRSRPDFQLILMDLAMPGQVFAPEG